MWSCQKHSASQKLRSCAGECSPLMYSLLLCVPQNMITTCVFIIITETINIRNHAREALFYTHNLNGDKHLKDLTT